MTDTEYRWWESHDNVVLLTAWMAEMGYEASQLAEAVEKPWQWSDEYRSARISAENEEG